MNLDLLRYFLAIAETGNFTRAAERTLISQPSLSSGIKKLERELGVILFERGGRLTQLTPAGQVFLEKAQKILQDYELALYQLRDYQKQLSLRLGVLSTLSIASVSELIQRFRQHHPDVILELQSSHLDNLNFWLADKAIDLAITVLDEANDKSENCLTLFRQRLLLAVPSTHSFAQRSMIVLQDLDNQPYIQRINCEFWRASPEIYELAGVTPNIIYRADCEEWVIALIQAGLGMSIMPEWPNLSGLVYQPVAELDLNRTIGLKWNPRDRLDVVDLFRGSVAQNGCVAKIEAYPEE